MDDLQAEKLLQEMRAAKAECDRLTKVSRELIAEYQEHIRSEEESCNRKIEYLSAQLSAYFEMVRDSAAATKTKLSYKLPTGTLTLKFGTPEFIRDDKKLVEFLESNNPELIKVTKKPDWDSLKKDLTFKDGKAITADGVIVNGVEVKERADTFEVNI